MKKTKLMALILMLITSLSVGCTSTNVKDTEEKEEKNKDNKEQEELLKEAYIYTFPLVIEDATLQKATNTETPTDNRAPINQLMHTKDVADASSRMVVTPNVDTVYSQAFLDLDKDKAFILKKPKTDRYCSIQILDGYTNTHALLGSGFDGQEEKTYLITREDYDGEIPNGVTHIKMDTDIVWMIVRTICNGKDDLENVYKVQDKMELIPLEYYKSNKKYTPPKGTYNKENDFVPVEYVLKMTPKEYFDKANELMKDNPPTKEDKEIIDKISAVGVGPGLKFDESILGDNEKETWTNLLKTAKSEVIEEATKFNKTNNGWSYYGKPIGDFGTEYKFRTAVALKGLGANPVDVAIYAKTNNDCDNNKLNGKNTYVIHFDKDKLPPVEKYGFWSITAYGEDDFLIDNKENKYSISDRSDFKYNDDGSLDLYVSAKKPENVDKENWLPVKDDLFHLCFRIYLPSESVKDGSWKIPKVEKYTK